MNDPRIVAVGAPATFRQQVARALEVMPDAVEWSPTVTSAEESLERNGGADMLVLSPGIKDPDALGLAEFVARTAPATAVVVVRDRITNGLVPAAMRAGARDVVDLSAGSDELRDALERAMAWSSSLRVAQGEAGHADEDLRGKIVSVLSSKGGAGKTFLASNLALTVARRSGQDAAVVDLDLAMGDVFAYFDEEPRRNVHDLVALGDHAEQEEIRAAGVELGEHLWGYGAPPDPAAELVPGEAIGRLLRRMRSTFGHIVVDTPAGYSDQVLAALDVSDTILLVVGLDVVSVRHLSMALDTLYSLDIPRDRLRIVLNRADSKVGLGPSEVERVVKVKVDAMIPSSRLVPTCLNKGRPLVLEEPASGVARSIDDLAAKILGQPAPGRGRRRRFLRR